MVCAYQRGLDGVAGGAAENCAHGNAAPTGVLTDLPESQAGPGVARHRCAVCAYAAGVRDSLRDTRYPDEIDAQGTYPEGAATTVTVNQYERNTAARAACIAHYGCNCTVCGMNFAETYGAQVAGLIHVHHLRSIASVGMTYDVDPIADLRPVCPNCHAVIHRGDPMRSIEEVRTMLVRTAEQNPKRR